MKNLLLLAILFTMVQSKSNTMYSQKNTATPSQNKTTESHNFDSSNTAIIVIEFQKTWTEKGFFHFLIKKELKRKQVIENTIHLLDQARAANYPIIQAPLILDVNAEDYKQIPLIPRLFKRFTKDTWKAEFTPNIYKETDLIVEGRCGFDACEGSNLEQLIKDLEVQNLLFVGFTTEHCVEMTMETLQKSYNCVLITDCTATKSSKLQNKVEKRQNIIDSKGFINAFVVK